MLSGSTLGGESPERELFQLREQEKQHDIARKTWTQEKHIAEKKYQNLEETLRAANKRVLMNEEHLRKTNKDLQQQLTRAGDLDQANKVLRERNTRLRGVFTKRSNESESIDDNSIVASFVSLRQQIQRIVSGHYIIPQIPNLTSASDIQKAFFSIWLDKFSESQLRNRVRAKVFELLSNAILRSKCFGLDGVESHDGLPVEAGLANFETLLDNIGPGKKIIRALWYAFLITTAHEKSITEWRTATLKCVGLLPNVHRSLLPQATAQAIWDFMIPLAPLSEKPVKEVGDLLVKLCSDSLRFALDLRKSQHNYSFEEPSEGQPVDENEVEPQASENNPGLGYGSPIIAFSLSSALVKYPAHSIEERVVLEKAHVVILEPK